MALSINQLSNPNLSTITSNIPSSFKATGKEKLYSIMIQKVETLKSQIIPPLSDILNQFNSSNSELNQCNIEKIRSVPNMLNKIILKTNNVFKFIEKNKSIISNLDILSKTLNTTLTALTITRVGLSVGVKFIPSPPGAPGIVVSSLNDLKDLQDKLSPRLEKILKGVDLLTFSLAIAYATLLIIISFLKGLISLYENLVKKCFPQTSLTQTSLTQTIPNIESLIPIDPGLEELERIKNEVDSSPKGGNTYKGFILEIIQEPFTPTVNRNVGIAKNSQGIVLLKTLPSFTTIPQLLIEELKLIIDRDNLYAV